MQLARPLPAASPLRFGRGRRWLLSAPDVTVARQQLSAEVKLFATTFAAGFLFVSVLLA